ncbi:MAG: amidohydrolase family protein [Planctomycetota bacterium]|nr:amidohydrolase family protein [Planctomycetota bacterium]
MMSRISGSKEPMLPKKLMTPCLLVSLVATLLLLFSAHTAQAAESKIALTGGTVMTVSGESITGGVVLIENGIIMAVGAADTEIPYDAMEVDCTGMILAPGFVDPHSSDGLDIPNENLPSAPFVDVFDALDPSRFFFEDSLRNGVTSIHVIQGNNCVVGGVSRIVHPIGLTPHEMSRQAGVALKLSTTPRRGYGRMRQLAELREVFQEYDRWRENLAESRYEQEAGKDDDDDQEPLSPEESRLKGQELIRDEDLDDQHRHLAQLIDGRLGAWIYCGSASDVAPALALVAEREWKDRAVLVLGGDSHLAIDEIDEAGLHVVLDSDLIYRKRDPLTGEVEETFIPGVYRRAGVRFAIQPSRSGAMPERFIGYQAARLVRSGLTPAEALRIVTLGAAEICGIDDRYGSIEVGKIGNIVMWTGDPLDLNSWVQKVFIEGILAYDREKDARLQRLFPEVPEAVEAPAPLEDEGDVGESEEKVVPAVEAPEKPAGEAPPKDGEPLKEKSSEKGDAPADQRSETSGGDAPKDRSLAGGQ